MPLDTFAQVVHDAHNSNFIKKYRFVVGLTSMFCEISLQFCCEFIDNNRSIISPISSGSDIAKLMGSLSLIINTFHLGFNLARYKFQDNEDKNESKSKKLIRDIGSFALLTHFIIKILTQAKIIHFLFGNNEDIISYISLTSTILFLFSECISCCFAWKEYQDNKDPKKFAQLKKKVIFSTITSSLNLLIFILKRVEVATTSMSLGSGIICNSSWSTLFGIALSAVYLVSNYNKLVSQPINNTGSPTNDTNPSTNINEVNPVQPGVDSNHTCESDIQI